MAGQPLEDLVGHVDELAVVDVRHGPVHGRQDPVGDDGRTGDGHELAAGVEAQRSPVESGTSVAISVRAGRARPPQTARVSSIELRPVRSDQVEELCALTNRVAAARRAAPRADARRAGRGSSPRRTSTSPSTLGPPTATIELAGWVWIWNPPSESGSSGRTCAARWIRAAGPGRGLGADRLEPGPGRGAAPQPGPRPAPLRQGRGLRLDGGQPPALRPLRLHARALVRGARPAAVDLPAVEVADGVVLRPWPDDQDEVIWRRAQRGLRRPLGIGAGRRGRRGTRSCGATAPGSTCRWSRVEEATGEVVGLCLNQRLPGGRRAHRAPRGVDREPGHGRARGAGRGLGLVHDRVVHAGLRRGRLHPRHDRRRHRQPDRRGPPLPRLGLRAPSDARSRTRSSSGSDRDSAGRCADGRVGGRRRRVERVGDEGADAGDVGVRGLDDRRHQDQGAGLRPTLTSPKTRTRSPSCSRGMSERNAPSTADGQARGS